MLLARLSNAAGVSSQENEIRDLIKQEASAKDGVEIKTDALGNLFARKRGKGEGPTVMVAAHMDEVGLMVVGVENSGLLRFRPMGGIDLRVLVAKQVFVGPERIPGVIGSKPIHLQKPEERRTPFRWEELYIDIGAKNKEEASRLVPVGTTAIFATVFQAMSDDLVMGKALDDRVGCKVLLDLLDGDYNCNLVAAFTVQEEVGLRGAGVAAYSVDPDLALVIEGTTASDVPGVKPHGHATSVGKGPALTFMDRVTIPAKPIVEKLQEVAKQEGISTQYRRATTGGTDAGVIRLTKGGIPVAGVSVPCRYIHSPASVASLKDIDATIRLVKAFLRTC
ncbi:MAG: M42 family metallopeptidase [Firmicutes bacterium]|nr:M42 family metallopeptidase [Bacillota bacterium]